MIIRNRTFFIAENVSDHNRMRLAKEILMRGGILITDPFQQTDYEIFDAEKEYLVNRNIIHERSGVRVSVNEMTRMIDCTPSAGADEFCIHNGEMSGWIPEEHHGHTLMIPAGTRSIKSDAFQPVYSCQKSIYRKEAGNITRIVLPKTLQSIEPDAFSCFANLTRVVFPERMREVNGFARCRKLTGITLPRHCEKIGDRAFAGCTCLKEVIWSEEINTIGSYAFQRTAITEFHSWEALERIGCCAFAHCENLHRLSLEGNALHLDTGAFKNSGIRDLKIRLNACELKGSCFKGCMDLDDADTSSSWIRFTPSSFEQNITENALKRIQSKECTEQYAKMWKDMIRTHSSAFLRQTDPILLWRYADLIRPLTEKEDDSPEAFRKKLIALEAELRMDLLKKQCGLTPLVKKRYREGKLYYSYLTARGLLGSVDSVTYDPLYEKTVYEAVSMYGIHVYHCVESKAPWHMLTLLYVGSDPDQWNYERPEKGIMPAYVHNFELNEGEFGDVRLVSYDGALVRTG